MIVTILLIIAALFAFAAAVGQPKVTNISLGWFAVFFFILSFLVPS